MKLADRKVDPSELSKSELDQLEPILELASRRKRAALKGSDGKEYPLPKPILRILVEIIAGMRAGKSLVVLLEEKPFTTQAAADYLGMSRQHLVTLLESGKIPFHRVGSHRRIAFTDVMEYAQRRDRERSRRLSNLFMRLHREGFYDSTLTSAEDAG